MASPDSFGDNEDVTFEIVLLVLSIKTIWAVSVGDLLKQMVAERNK